jgi:TonB-dependent starch-binding outer membrane protein SusC
MMDGPQFARFLQESWMDRIRYFEDREPTLDEVPEGIRYPEQTQHSTDWLGEILNQNAPFQNYNLTLASGQGKIKSLVSAGYLKQQGALIETDFERYSIRANVTGDINDFISMGINLTGAYSGGKIAATSSRDAIVGKALWADPRDPVYNEDGTFNDYIGGKDGVFGSTNPVMELHQHERIRYANNITSNGFVEVSFLKDFKFRTSFNANIGSSQRKDFRPSTLAGAGFNNPPPQPAQLWEWHDKSINIAADQLLSYSKNINNHQVDGMLGFSAQEDTWKQLYGYGLEFPNNEIRFMQEAENIDASSNESSWSMLAYFARVNYSFANKYLLSASFRREGSSRFGENNKFGDFPAVSLGWRLTEESFMPDISWLDDLKLRGSYGVTGNNSIGNYNNSASMVSSGYILGNQYAPGVVLNAFVNRNIGWEESNQLDIGLDLSSFNNKLVFAAEYYKKITNSMLLPVSIPSITGFTNTFTNVGKVQNKGAEFEVTYKTRVNNNLNIRTNFNIAINRNKVLEIDNENDELWTGSFYGVYNRSVVGRPIGMITGYKVLGLFQSEEEIENSPTQDGAIPGSMKMWDADGNGKITYDTEDMVEIGNPHPSFTWGFTLGADYKQFDLNILFTGAQDYDIMRDIEKTTLNMDGVFNVLERAENRFRSPENPGDGRSPTASNWKWERESSSFYVYDASHAWVKSITLGYTLKGNAKILKNARFYLNADNLLLITNYPGNNPDVNTGDSRSPGRDDEAYPVPRTLSFGANIKF